MPARILSGKPIADEIKAEVAAEAARIREVHGFLPCLAVVRVGHDPASAVYVESKVRTSKDLGLISEHHHFEADVSHKKIAAVVDELNSRNDVDGILVQLPLPAHVDEQDILERIDPEKDVDGFHPVNAGHLMQGFRGLVPCTPAGVIEVLTRSNIDIAGRNAVVVGRSNIVGKPMAMLLLQANATVTICHSQSRNLADIAKKADILVAAIGKAGFIRGEHIGEGATVIDVGINNVSNASVVRELFGDDEIQKRLATIKKRGFTLVGDVSPKEAVKRASNFTPVPGGIGLLTVAMLMKNTLTAAKMRRNI